MNPHFVCENPGRRRAVRSHDTLNGIDYLEVLDDPASPKKDRQRFLQVHLLKPLSSQLSKENFSIDGGVRITNIHVVDAPLVTPRTLQVEVNQRGDFSSYTLRLTQVDAGSLLPAPGGIVFAAAGTDPALNELALDAATPVQGVVSADLSAYAGLSQDPARFTITIGAEGPHEVLIPGQPSTLEALRDAVEAGVHAAHASGDFAGTSVALLDASLAILPPTPGTVVSFSSVNDDPALTELGLAHPRPVNGVQSGDLSLFDGLSRDPARLKLAIGNQESLSVTVSGEPADLETTGASLADGIRDASASAFFRGARVVAMNDRLLVFSGQEQFDPVLSSIDFSFKVGCPSQFDCGLPQVCPNEQHAAPEINYLAKDYNSLRRLMLDRLSIIMPDWQERNAADAQIALVEMLAYVGDHLSYFQDAVATEAYLGVARQRVSIRRHARLLDYPMHDGCNSRVWICLKIKPNGDADGNVLPAGTPLLTKGDPPATRIDPASLEEMFGAEEISVFETLHDATLHSSHNSIELYTWSDAECCLPRGATRATLRSDPPLFLQKGDVILFEEIVSPTTGAPADADPSHRHAVRLTSVNTGRDPLDGTGVMEVEWHAVDALPFPVCISAMINDAGGQAQAEQISVVRGNVILADYGRSVTEDLQLSATQPPEGRHRVKLSRRNLTYAVPYDDEKAREAAATVVLIQDAKAALPAKRKDESASSGMSLTDNDETWTVRRDLLGSDRFQAHFIVEVEQDRSAYLRFGNGINGKAPAKGTLFHAAYRVGNGAEGNVGAGAIARLATDFENITRVWNPLPAVGGTNAESMTQVRTYAPQAFRKQQRAVTEADYSEVAQRHPEVQKATATFRWTGSWYTVFVTIDRMGGLEVDDAFKAELNRYLEQFRIMGYDLEINGPVYIPLDITIRVCIAPDHFQSHVRQRLVQTFSRYGFPDGRRGFFHPDNFTFGQPVYLSHVYRHALNVDGVTSVEVLRFQQWGKTAADEIEKGYLKPENLQVIRLDNDPNFPEFGKIEFEMHGGV